MFLTPFRGDFETESKRNKIPEKNFSVTEEDHEAWEPRKGGPRGPTSPHPAARGEATAHRLVGPLDLLCPRFCVYICPKIPEKLGDHRKYFSATASFYLRKISSRARFGALPEGGFGYGGLLHQHHDLSDDA